MIDPAYAEAYYALGLALAQQKNHASAKEAVEKALELKPDYSAAQAILEELDGDL